MLSNKEECWSTTFLFIFCFIITSGAVLFLLLRSENPEPSTSYDEHTRLIENVGAKITTNRQVSSVKTICAPSNLRPTMPLQQDAPKKTISELYGTGRPYTNQTEIARSKYDCFEHPSEMHLAFLANTPIGQMVIGEVDFDDDFMQDLQQALIDKIVINDDDDEDTIAIKQSVEDVKNELIELLKNGEDIAEILTNTRSELKQLGIYKEQLAEMIEDGQYSDGLSDEEVEDFVTAANIMLQEKGIEPLHFSKTTKMILRTKPLMQEEYDLEETDEF